MEEGRKKRKVITSKSETTNQKALKRGLAHLSAKKNYKKKEKRIGGGRREQ